MTATRRTVRTGNPRVDVRALLDSSVGSRVILYREDVEAILALASADPDLPAGSILLTADMEELVAEAAWSSAPRTRVAAHGTWDDLAEDDPKRAETLAAARRFMHYLFTGEALPEDEDADPRPAPRTA